MTEWNFASEIIAKAQEIGIGDRVAVHWSEAECQDQEGTVIGVEIHRHGKVEYAVHIDGDISPTDGFTHDRSGLQGGTIALTAARSTSHQIAVKALGAWRRGYCDDRVTIEQASTGFGSIYQVRVFDGIVWLDLPDQRKEEFSTVVDAKAAAQTDFDQRIRSALEQSP